MRKSVELCIRWAFDQVQQVKDLQEGIKILGFSWFRTGCDLKRDVFMKKRLALDLFIHGNSIDGTLDSDSARSTRHHHL